MCFKLRAASRKQNSRSDILFAFTHPPLRSFGAFLPFIHYILASRPLRVLPCSSYKWRNKGARAFGVHITLTGPALWTARVISYALTNCMGPVGAALTHRLSVQPHALTNLQPTFPLYATLVIASGWGSFWFASADISCSLLLSIL